MSSKFPWISFTAAAVITLLMGSVAADFLWRASHRYEQPLTGLFYGAVQGRFYSFDEPVYSFSFEGRTTPRWYWSTPTNYAYSELTLNWKSSGGAAPDAILSLPSLTFRAGTSQGGLTEGVLASWLCAGSHSDASSPDALRASGHLLAYLKAAGDGSLPPPRHHPLRIEQPVRGHIAHFSCGYGINGYVYCWGAIWLALFIALGIKLRRENDRS